MPALAHRPRLRVGVLLLALTAIGFVLVRPTPLRAEDALVAAECDGCHRLAPPAPEARSVAAWDARKGPDLFYAGSKYRREWLREWLRAPERIRPAGMHPDRHVRSVEGEDRLDASTLEPHPRVSDDAVDALVEALLARTWGSERLPADVTPTRVPRPLAEMNFIKFKGCASCHRTSQEFGGVTGPALYDAWDRLRPEFLWSYVADPQVWDPVAPMPGYDLPPAEVGKLLEYLRLLSEEHRDDE